MRCVARVDQSFVQRSVRLTCTSTILIWRSKPRSRECWSKGGEADGSQHVRCASFLSRECRVCQAEERLSGDLRCSRSSRVGVKFGAEANPLEAGDLESGGAFGLLKLTCEQLTIDNCNADTAYRSFRRQFNTDNHLRFTARDRCQQCSPLDPPPPPPPRGNASAPFRPPDFAARRLAARRSHYLRRSNSISSRQQ